MLNIDPRTLLFFFQGTMPERRCGGTSNEKDSLRLGRSRMNLHQRAVYEVIRDNPGIPIAVLRKRLKGDMTGLEISHVIGELTRS